MPNALLRVPAAGLGVALLLFAALAGWIWDGIGPRDAAQYARAAMEWHDFGPTLGETHWALRWPLVVPMAATLSAFGPSEWAAALPAFAYGAALIVVAYLWAAQVFGAATGAALAFVLATSAYLGLEPTDIRIYGPELLFQVLSLALLSGTLARPAPRRSRLLLAGAIGGVAWLCRETSGVMPFLYIGAAFLLCRPIVRAVQVAGATLAGFAAVLVAEAIGYGVVAGDPFYRVRASLGHGEGTPGTGPGIEAWQSPSDFVIDPIIQALSSALLWPYLALGLPVLVFLVAGRGALGTPERRALQVFGLGAVGSFLLCAYGLSLEDVNYYPLVGFFFALLTAMGLARLWSGQRRAVSVVLGGGLLFANLALLDLRDRDLMAEARLLADLAARDGPITADDFTADRAEGLLALRGRRDIAITRPGDTIAGAVLVANPPSDTAIPVDPDWEEVARYAPRRRGPIAAWLARWVPLAPLPETVLYRAGGGAG